MTHNIIDAQLVEQVKTLFQQAQQIVIVAHVGPDGDALGSSLGLQHFLATMKKSSTIIYPSPYPDFIGWIPGVEKSLIYTNHKNLADSAISRADLIVALDFNTSKRLSTLEEPICKAEVKKIMIDHHLFPDKDFADVIISHPEISSTSELVFRLICQMGYERSINLPCAEAIYTGMMTDTGAFTYNSNQKEIYNIVSKLIEIGVQKDEIYRKVFNTFSEDRMRLQGYCIYEKMKIYPEHRTALITLTQEELKDFHYQNGDAEGFVNIPLSIKNIVFSVFMREDSDKIKISLRSQGTFPANQFSANIFNGGGHLNAAGGESYKSLEETIRLFENALPKFQDLLQQD